MEKKYDIKIIHKNTEYYNSKLLQMKHPPDFLFAVGNLDLLKDFCVGVVGARSATIDSNIVAKQLVNELCEMDITVISGMANGIDCIAHESCMEYGGKTIAIIGCGFDKVKNKKIFSKILSENGLILSEYFPDIPAFPYNFPRRNEILVAFSKAIVAVEVHGDSGTMITAKHALAKSVPLYTFPGALGNKKFVGNNFLLTCGAICLESGKSIRRALIQQYPEMKFAKRKHKTIKKQIIPNEYKEIYAVLNQYPQSIHEILQKLNVSINELQNKLVQMEIDDLVIKLPNNLYIRP